MSLTWFLHLNFYYILFSFSYKIRKYARFSARFLSNKQRWFSLYVIFSPRHQTHQQSAKGGSFIKARDSYLQNTAKHLRYSAHLARTGISVEGSSHMELFSQTVVCEAKLTVCFIYSNFFFELIV